MKKSNRRDFLKGSGTLLTGTMLSNLVFQSILEKAIAQASGQEPINYALINEYYAPPRWYFDLPLNAAAGAPIVNPDRSFGNAFKNLSGTFVPDYASFPVKNAANRTFYMPTLWQQQVPNGSGGKRPLKDVLRHGLFVRGINNLINGHEVNNQMIVAPQLTEKTLLGLNSDRSSRPFATVLHGYATTFANKGENSGNSPIILSTIGGDAQVATLLAPFTDGETIFNRKLSVGTEARIGQALDAFRVYAEDNLKLKQSDISQVQKNARASMKDFMERSGELTERWKGTLRRYQNIVKRSLTPAPNEMPGLNGTAVPCTGRKCDNYSGTYLVTADLREMTAKQPSVQVLAEGFALIEFLFSEKLASTVSFTPGNVSAATLVGANFTDLRYSPLDLQLKMNVIKANFAKATFDQWNAGKINYAQTLGQIQSQINALPAGSVKNSLKAAITAFNSGKPATGLHTNASATIAVDQHNIGAMISIYATTLYYRALGACLGELIDKLTAAGVFNRTLLHIAGDFNRNPLKDGSGSDHGYEGSSQSFFTGMMDAKGPYVIGNVAKSGGADDTHSPGWGYAAPILIRKASGSSPKVERPIQPGDVANSVAALLGIPSVSTNGYTLFGRDSAGKLALYVVDCRER